MKPKESDAYLFINSQPFVKEGHGHITALYSVGYDLKLDYTQGLSISSCVISKLS